LESKKDYLDLREHVKAYRDDGDVDQPRFGYEEEDAVKIMELLKEGIFFRPGGRIGSGVRAADLGVGRLERQGCGQGAWSAAYGGHGPQALISLSRLLSFFPGRIRSPLGNALE